ncbi:MAG: hypothetical protein PHP10_03590 [Candidatus Omnitrophica bacterium]|nr:hypothetical protein [Candidatus Omnitrophota bacterium]
MPLLLGIPIIAGLVGLFAGAQVDRAVDNATTPPAGGTAAQPMSIWVKIALIAAGLIIVLVIVKKVMKKF